MATVIVPPMLRHLTGGAGAVRASGRTVAEVIVDLDRAYPGMADRLRQGDRLREGIAVAVDGDIAPLELLQPVSESSEVTILPAIAGGFL